MTTTTPDNRQNDRFGEQLRNALRHDQETRRALWQFLEEEPETINTEVPEQTTEPASEPELAPEATSAPTTEAGIAQLTATLERFIETTDRNFRELRQDLRQDIQESHSGLLAEIHDTQEKMDAGYHRLHTRVQSNHKKLTRRLSHLDRQIGDASGDEYERRAALQTPRLLNRDKQIRLQKARSVWAKTHANPPLRDQLDQALAAGRVTKDEVKEIKQADLVFRGSTTPKRARRPQYALLEASRTVQAHDVERARDRALLLAQALGEPVAPAVIGQTINPNIAQYAARLRVHWLQTRQPDE